MTRGSYILGLISVAGVLAFQAPYYTKHNSLSHHFNLFDSSRPYSSRTRLKFWGNADNDNSDSDEKDGKKMALKKQFDNQVEEPNEKIANNALWLPQSINNFVTNINLGNVVGGTFLGIFIVLFSLFGPIFFGDDGMYSPDSGTIIAGANDDTVITPGSATNTKEAVQKSVTLFSDILFQLRNGYVDEVDQSKLFETAVDSMLRSLDPYTEFENTKQSKAIQESVSGRYGGVGLVIANTKEPATIGDNKNKGKTPTKKAVQKGVVVVDAFEGYAYDNGLRIGDRLLSVNSIDVHGKDVEKVRDLLRGEPDTEVSVTYERDDPQNLGIRETTLKRKAIRLSDVRLATFLGDPADGIGYINLAGFNAGAGKDFKTAFLMLKYSALQEGNGLQGLVLDLRGNPGGLLDAAVEIASYLVPKDSEIVTARSRNGPSIIYKSSNDPIRDEDTKIIVLVNENSASASEIVSGAVQDLDAGVIMGSSRTYGKGLVQKIVPLPYESALKYTIAKYYTPSGRCIQSIQYRGGRDDTSLIENAQSIAGVSEGFVDNKDEENDNDDNNEGRIIEANDQDKKMTEQDFANTQIRKGTYQDLMDGASSIKDQDRKVFLTTNGRMVKDGGGIEPDIIVPENVLTPTEKIFVGQDLYSKFLKDYLKTHDVHGPLSAQVTAEREARNADLRYNNGVFGDVMARYLVLQTPEGPIRSFKGNNNIAYGKVTKDSLYNDFKVYVQRQVMDKKINLDGYSVDKSISALEDALKDNGVNSKYASALRNEITADVLKNMDKVKDNIIDGLEVALYAREVPDRLLIWRAVTDDQQVIAAADVIREQSNKGNSKQSNKDTLLKKYKLATDGYKFQSVREAEITQLDLENKGFRTVYEQALQRPIENSDTVVLSRSKPTTMEESSNHAAP